VVYQLLDNITFMVKKPDGTRQLPEKGPDGKYYVEGRLDIASREEVLKMASKSIPLLRARRPLQEDCADTNCQVQAEPLLHHKGPLQQPPRQKL
jgi:hypothetical protein